VLFVPEIPVVPEEGEEEVKEFDQLGTTGSAGRLPSTATCGAYLGSLNRTLRGGPREVDGGDGWGVPRVELVGND